MSSAKSLPLQVCQNCCKVIYNNQFHQILTVFFDICCGIIKIKETAN